MIVLFFNIVLILNLLIAIMSDTYARMSDLRGGLYWSIVIREMPKYKYDQHYGILVMMPFIFSWVGMFCLPFLLCIKDLKRLVRINEVLFFIAYSFIMPFLLALFISVNLILLPFAYLKTILHKILLVKSYRGREQCINLVVFIALGIPFLIAAQVTDVYYFLRHTYRAKQQK